MAKNCSRYPPASRADVDSSMSRRFDCRNNEFRLGDASTETDGMDVTGDGVFLMNRFYSEKIVRPMMECVNKEYAGEIGLTVSNRLEKAMQEKNGCIRGDELLELLKDGLGLDCAVSLIGQMKRFKKMGMYGDRIVTKLPKPAASVASSSVTPASKRACQLPDKECTAGKQGTCAQCSRKKGGKEITNWKTNSKTK